MISHLKSTDFPIGSFVTLVRGTEFAANYAENYAGEPVEVIDNTNGYIEGTIRGKLFHGPLGDAQGEVTLLFTPDEVVPYRPAGDPKVQFVTVAGLDPETNLGGRFKELTYLDEGLGLKVGDHVLVPIGYNEVVGVVRLVGQTREAVECPWTGYMRQVVRKVIGEERRLRTRIAAQQRLNKAGNDRLRDLQRELKDVVHNG